ncbi:2-oxo acid dehydrogenase subunit E2 [Spirillospora sp. NPDC127506]
MPEIRVPKLNNNDTEYVLVEWLAEDGAVVHEGAPLLVVETSKAAEELACETSGELRRLLPEGATCAPGQLVARIGDSTAEPEPEPASEPAPEPAPEPAAEPVAKTAAAVDADGTGPVITAPARALIDEHAIEPERVRALGLALVRRADVEKLIGGGTPALRPLPAVQRAVAATVERSRQTIPAAFTAIKVNAGPALARGKALTRELRALVGLPELVVQAVAGLHATFPMFFAEPVDGRDVRLSERPDIGVTVDVGKGLYVPVVRDAARRTLREIAETTMRFRMTALRGSFTEEDLAGGNIVIALNTDTDALLAIPIVHPGHACALSLCAPHQELVLTDDGEVAARTAVTLGLAYDHRLVNGRDALEFLHALRTALEGASA